jgi:hypothetical protein
LSRCVVTAGSVSLALFSLVVGVIGGDGSGWFLSIETNVKKKKKSLCSSR